MATSRPAAAITELGPPALVRRRSSGNRSANPPFASYRPASVSESGAWGCPGRYGALDAERGNERGHLVRLGVGGEPADAAILRLADHGAVHNVVRSGHG